MNIKKIIIISVLLYLSSSNFAFANEINYISKEEFFNYYNSLAQLHRDYLEIAVAIVLGSAAVFYFFNMLPLERKMGLLETKMQKQKQEMKVIKDSVIKVIKEELNKSLLEINNEQLIAQANISRLFAINAYRDGLYNKSFVWWLTCADYSYQENPKSKYVIDGIKFAEEQLEEILKLEGEEKKSEIELLKESLDNFEIKKTLNKLSEEYPEKIKKIKKILEEFLKI